MSIIQNAAYCKKCNQIVISNSHHDFKTCTCSNVSVDGGTCYLRRSINEIDLYEELTLTSESTLDQIMNKLVWGTRGKDGNEELHYFLIKSLDISHLQAILDNVKNIEPLHAYTIKYWFNDKKAKLCL
jgi:hypothetical protein